MSYGVGVTNRFDLLGEDESGTGVVVAKKPETKTAAAQQTVKPAQDKPKAASAEKKPAPRTSFKGERNGSLADPASDKAARGERTERRAPRNGATGAPRPGKREFDRRSGSDKSSVKPEDKRRGGGRFNWGEDVPKKTESAEGETTEAEAQPAAEGENKAESETNAQTEAVSDEPKEMTLSEYKKQLEKSQQSLAAMKLRQAGQDVDKAQWKDTVQMKREQNPEGIFALGSMEEKTSRRAAAPRDAREGAGAIPLNIRFSDTGRENRESRGDRGDRTSDRGRGRRSDARPDARPRENGNGPRRTSQLAPNVRDESAFPVLGK